MPTQLRRYDELGHVHFLTISCYKRLPFFRTPDARNVVVDSMSRCRSRLGFRWIGYVVMPEHVHWLCYPQTPEMNQLIRISDVLQSLKTSIGKSVKAHLRTVWSKHRSLGHAGLDRWAVGRFGEVRPIWTTRGIDFNVHEQLILIQKLDYCHANPVTRGLVDRAEDWSWSSYRFYEQLEPVLLRMDWDGHWPIE